MTKAADSVPRPAMTASGAAREVWWFLTDGGERPVTWAVANHDGRTDRDHNR